MQKIALVINSLTRGGAETVLMDLANQFRKEYEVHIILLEEVIKFEIAKNIKLHVLDKPNRNSIFKPLNISKYAKQLVMYLKANNIEYSISFLERSNFINGCAKDYYPQLKNIITVNTALSQWYTRTALRGIPGRFLVKKYYKRAEKVICCSDYVKNEMEVLFKVPHQKLVRIYNGIDLQKIKTLSSVPLDTKPAGYNFIHVGSFSKVKNHQVLLDAFELFLLTNRKAKLTLIGKGPLAQEIKNKIYATEALKNNVVFKGYVENQYNIMAASDCFVLSSNFEGLPTVILEAFACNINVISTDCISGPRELLLSNCEVSSKPISDIVIGDKGILCEVNSAQAIHKAMCAIVDDDTLQQLQKLNSSSHLADADILIMKNKYLVQLNGL
jgi:N-acetylgalactosamine-N,N'-diacetylbacillosaminyl-diphospho-undecaprenol 4-alpha-N-acetylgalactosaminyltransferase